MIRDEELIRDKLNFYKEKEFPVHIKLKTPFVPVEKSASFRNGSIKEINETHIILDDEKLGEIVIYLKEIWFVDKREVRK